MFASHRRFRLAATLPVLLSLVACASPSYPVAGSTEESLERQGYRQGASVDSIPAYTIDALIALNADDIVLYATGERRYLLRLAHTCPTLSPSSALAYTTTAGALTRFDKIILVDSPRSQPDCHIERIYALESLTQ